MCSQSYNISRQGAMQAIPGLRVEQAPPPTQLSERVANRYDYFTFTRRSLGTRAIIARVAKIQASPPLTTENSGVERPATRPDSNWPSIGPPITNMALAALIRPRNS